MPCACIRPMHPTTRGCRRGSKASATPRSRASAGACSADGTRSRRYLLQVGERREARDEIVAKIAKNLLWPLAVALPALGLLIWLGIDRALRPLRVVNRQVERSRARQSRSRSTRPTSRAEVAPLVDQPQSPVRARASLDRERAPVHGRCGARAADAACRAARAGTGGAGRRRRRPSAARALDNVIAGCDRASHLVEQLLTLARLEPEALRAAREPCDLANWRAFGRRHRAGGARKAIDVDLARGPGRRARRPAATADPAAQPARQCGSLQPAGLVGERPRGAPGARRGLSVADEGQASLRGSRAAGPAVPSRAGLRRDRHRPRTFDRASDR